MSGPGIKPGEDPVDSARRELREELGLAAGQWQAVTTVDPFTTVVVSPTQIYFATGLSEVARDPEGTEQIERVTMTLEEAVRLVETGDITHAPTCVVILMAQARLVR